MHEFSIALNIIEIADEHAKREKASIVHEIELEIGTLAGIDFSSLEFAMEISIKESILRNAEIKINKIKAEGECGNCNKKFYPENLFSQCAGCGSFDVKILKGNELRIKSLKIN